MTEFQIKGGNAWNQLLSPGWRSEWRYGHVAERLPLMIPRGRKKTNLLWRQTGRL
jgi:hypothetical protein